MSSSPFWRAIVACRAKRSACASAIGCAGEGFGAARPPESVLSRRRNICGRSANSFASALRIAGARLGIAVSVKGSDVNTYFVENVSGLDKFRKGKLIYEDRKQ